MLAKNAYQHRDDISQATQQFLDDIYDNKYQDPEWLAQHAQGFSQLLCDVFVAPRVGQKIAHCSTISPLTNGLRKQKEVVQACIRKGVNTAAQKAADSLKTIFKEAGDALKTGNLQPAFAGIDNSTHVNTVPDQPRHSERLMKKVGEASKGSSDVAKPGVLVGDVSELRKVKFFRGFQHGLTNHFFGQEKSSLKILDPGGNPEKWTAHIVQLAQQGTGPIREIPTGQIMEIMGAMQKSNGIGILNVGVRLFKKHDSDLWKLTTVLTEQNHPPK